MDRCASGPLAALLLGASLALALPPAFLEAQVPAGTQGAPAALGSAATQACEAHLRSGFEGLTPVPAGIRAGTEQDGFILVSGRVTFRGSAEPPAPFACLVAARGSQVMAAVLPPRPAGAGAPREPGAQPPGVPPAGTTGRPTTLNPAQLAACREAVVATAQREYGTRPVFEARSEAVLHADRGEIEVTGRGTLPRNEGPLAVRYVCVHDAGSGALRSHRLLR